MFLHFLYSGKNGWKASVTCIFMLISILWHPTLAVLSSSCSFSHYLQKISNFISYRVSYANATSDLSSTASHSLYPKGILVLQAWICFTFSCTTYEILCAFVLSHFSCITTLCDPMDCSPPGSSVHRILQARILEWVTMPSARGSFQPRGQTHISQVSCISKQVLCHWHHLGSP